MVTVDFAGSRYESQKDAPDGVTESIAMWLRAAGLDGHFTYRAVDRTKGTGTMSRVHAIGVRDGKFVNARIRPEGLGNDNSWIVSIPSPEGMEAEALLRRLQDAERVVNGDDDQVIASKLAMLHTYLEGKPIDLETLDPRMSAFSRFETVEYLERDLQRLAARKLFVRRIGDRRYGWRKAFQKVPVPSLEQKEWVPTPLEIFVISLNPDERVLVRDLVGLHSQILREDGAVELRLPNQLPLFDEEVSAFMEKAEQAGLVKAVGENPHGILGKVWTLDFPILLVCILQMSFIFREDVRKEFERKAARDGRPLAPGQSVLDVIEVPPGTPGINQGLVLMSGFLDLTGCEMTDEVHDPPIVVPAGQDAEGEEIVMEFHRTTTLRAPRTGEAAAASPSQLPPSVEELREGIASQRRTIAEVEHAESELATREAETQESERRLLADLSRIQEELQRVRAAFPGIDARRQELRDERGRAMHEIGLLNELIARRESETASAVADQLIGLAQSEAGKLGISSEALREALLQRLRDGN